MRINIDKVGFISICYVNRIKLENIPTNRRVANYKTKGKKKEKVTQT